MNGNAKIAVPEQLSNSRARYGDLLLSERRTCIIILVVGSLVCFPAGALFFEWFAAPRAFSDLSFVSLSYWAIYFVIFWSVVRIIWTPFEEKKREIEAEFLQHGLRIFQVKGTKLDIAELEDK